MRISKFRLKLENEIGHKLFGQIYKYIKELRRLKINEKKISLNLIEKFG